ncbi:MAG TPA: sugar phosphate isomerase/epimerase, partial [Planctomycetes bacterium]|nr:sugar phosphate isomerase/epimerase [Planctomycetota bacterium]
MRLGWPVQAQSGDPGEWAAALKALACRAAYCPIDETAAPDDVRAFAAAADTADIVIAEVGAWSNPISPDAAERRRAVELCQKRLALADVIGARCCVNIAGSRGRKWDGP